MVSIAQIGIRTFQFVFNLITMALVGNAIARQAFSNSSVNYAMFTTAWNWIVIIYGFAAAFIDGLNHPIIILTLEVLAVLFNFVAGVVLAAKLHVHSCGNFGYLITNSLTQGSGERCRELQASTAFFWFLFAAFIASAAVAGLSGGNSFTSRRSGGIRTGGPSMSHV